METNRTRSEIAILNRLKNTQVLLIDDDSLIVAKRDRVFRIFDNGEQQHLFDFESSWSSVFLDRSRLLYRLRRCGVFSSGKHDGIFFFSRRGKIWSFAKGQTQPRMEFAVPDGNGPLTFTSINDLPSFESSIYFGEYFGNSSRRPIRLFRRDDKGQWEACYSFNEGQIEHVHGMVPDPINNCVWILTGDFGSGAAIWRARNNFEEVELVVGGAQKFRSCVGFPTPQGLLYATDSQLETNQLRLLSNKDGSWESRVLCQINGSCIDGCELKDYFVFSTATEPGKVIKPTSIIQKLWAKFLFFFDNRPGPGILSNQTDIVVCPKNNIEQSSVVYSVKKDIFPFGLFQFGRAKFPFGENRSNRLHAYFVATKENDLSSLSWQLPEISQQQHVTS